MGVKEVWSQLQGKRKSVLSYFLFLFSVAK